MITEDYVSYEVAKLLKEKGFDESCKAYYEDGKFCWVWNDGCSRNTDNPKYVSCPTQQMARKWFRREKCIIIFIVPTLDDKGNFAYCYEIVTWNEEEGIYEEKYMSSWFHIFEEAVDAALMYCLTNMI